MPRNPDKIGCSVGFPEGFETFASIPDPCDGGNTRHHFGEILFMAFAALPRSVRSYELMEEFGELKESWLHEWLKLPHGIPCANTFSRVFQAIEPAAFVRWIAALGFAVTAGQIAIDGKTLRGSPSGECQFVCPIRLSNRTGREWGKSITREGQDKANINLRGPPLMGILPVLLNCVPLTCYHRERASITELRLKQRVRTKNRVTERVSVSRLVLTFFIFLGKGISEKLPTRCGEPH